MADDFEHDAETAEVDPNDLWNAMFEPIKRLDRDVRRAAATLGDAQARHLVDGYYISQENRKRSFAQVRALEEGGEPASVLHWLAAQSETLEAQIKIALDVYTAHHKMGSWMRGVHGIGPVISAGLLAHIYMGMWCAVCRGRDEKDCERRTKKYKFDKHLFQPVESIPTVGHIWSFAGWAADGQKPWEKGQRRPFNQDFKTLCWKAGQSFMKFSNSDACYYGKVYRARKQYEITNNDNGMLVDKALERAPTVKSDTDAWAWYNGCYPGGMTKLYAQTPIKPITARAELCAANRLEPGKGIPMLPPAHIDARARRYAVKLFLAHMFDEWYRRQWGKEPPAPYPIAHLGHVHMIHPPQAA